MGDANMLFYREACRAYMTARSGRVPCDHLDLMWDYMASRHNAESLAAHWAKGPAEVAGLVNRIAEGSGAVTSLAPSDLADFFHFATSCGFPLDWSPIARAATRIEEPIPRLMPIVGSCIGERLPLHLLSEARRQDHIDFYFGDFVGGVEVIGPAFITINGSVKWHNAILQGEIRIYVQNGDLEICNSDLSKANLIFADESAAQSVELSSRTGDFVDRYAGCRFGGFLSAIRSQCDDPTCASEDCLRAMLEKFSESDKRDWGSDFWRHSP